MIYWVPDAIPIVFTEFISHFINLFSFTTIINHTNLSNLTNKFIQIYGYSCRSLFEVLFIILLKKSDTLNKKINLYTTPYHHTSFKLIIEKYIPKENINILDINDFKVVTFNETENETVNETKNDNKNIFNIVVVSHMFGQDLDLVNLEKKKESNNLIIIEDRVQGGGLSKKFSHECVDISLYSCGMDKRPVALGGGCLYINKDSINTKFLLSIKNEIVEKIESQPEETRINRLMTLLNKIPTYFIYNYSWVPKYLFKFFEYIGYKQYEIIDKYRKNNPGFVHNNYLKKPSLPLLKSLYENRDNYRIIESTLIKKYRLFYNGFDKEFIYIYFPWIYYNNENIEIVTLYNTIFIPDIYINKFKNIMDKSGIPYYKNPTWKSIDKVPTNIDNYSKFLNNLYYLPCLYNMNNIEIKELQEILISIN